MRGYMDYLEEAFYDATGWDIDRSYANVVLSSSNVLDFTVPRGVGLSLSSQPSHYSFTTCGISTLLGVLQGSCSYLYTSVPLVHEPSSTVPLHKLVQCFRQPQQRILPSAGDRSNGGTLLYGRMYLPGQPLEAMLIHKVTSATQLVAKWICDPRLVSPVVLTTCLQRSTPKWTSEYLWSSHENLVGFRALINMATWHRDGDPSVQSRLASGLEVFYAASKKSPGLSLATRYSTHSRYTAVPLTLTLVSNPLMGSVSIAYALKPTASSAFSSRYDFNFYSYMSDLTVGAELWRSRPISLQAKAPDDREGPISVFKASTSLASQTAKFVWESSYRGFLISTGIHFCYGDRATPAHMGLELVYSN